MERFLKSRYRIGEKISENPFSVSYKGYFIGTDKPLIIKIYKRGSLNSSLINQMKRKVKEFSQIKYHGIAQLIDGDYGWQGFFYVREYVNGQNLREILDENGDIGADKAAAIAEEVARTLEEVHSRGIIHGGLKPSNIFIDRQGVVKISDFIIEGEIRQALPQKALMFLEDGYYASPEEIMGKPASFASDIYSLGMILAETLLPNEPIAKKGLPGGLEKLKTGSLMNKDSFKTLPRYLHEILHKALQANPRLRFARMGEFRESLEKKSLFVSAPVNEEFLTIFENSVNRYGEERVREENEQEREPVGQKISKDEGRSDKIRNLIIALLLLLSFISGLGYVFLFGR